MQKLPPKGIPPDVQRLRKKDFVTPGRGPFRKGHYSDIAVKAPKESIAAKEEELRIRDSDGNLVATIPKSRNAKVNQELLIRAANSIINVAVKLRQDPIMVAKLLEDGQVIAGALTTAFDGMQNVVSYMGELREYFPGISLDQVPKEELQAAIDQIKNKRENPTEQ